MDKAHKRLKAWQLAMDLCMKTYEVTENFQHEKLFCLLDSLVGLDGFYISYQ